MATVTLKGNPFNTAGELPVLGATAPDFHPVSYTHLTLPTSDLV